MIRTYKIKKIKNCKRKIFELRKIKKVHGKRRKSSIFFCEIITLGLKMTKKYCNP